MILMAIDLSNISGLSVSICLAAVLPNDSNNRYVGRDFRGWQIQPAARTVDERIDAPEVASGTTLPFSTVTRT